MSVQIMNHLNRLPPLNGHKRLIRYAAQDWESHQITSGPRKGQSVFKNRRTGEIRDTPFAKEGQTKIAGKPKSPAAPDDSAEHFDNAKSHVRSLLQRAGEVPAALKDKMKSFVVRKYEQLSARYGPTGAKAVLASMILLTPIPLPGTSLLPVALAEAVRGLAKLAVGAKEDTTTQYRKTDWQSHKIQSGPRKGQSAFKNRVTGEITDKPPEESESKTEHTKAKKSAGKPNKAKRRGNHGAIERLAAGAGISPTELAHEATNIIHEALKEHEQPTSDNGGESAKIEKGFVHPTKGEIPEDAGKQSTPEECRAAVKKALEKFAEVPQPTRKEVKKARAGLAAMGANKYRRKLVGNVYDRRKRRTALLEEFGDGKTCPCVYCGIKIGEGSLEQDKIMTTAQGGKYQTPNLLPSCSDCNKRRGDKPFAEFIKEIPEYA